MIATFITPSDETRVMKPWFHHSYIGVMKPYSQLSDETLILVIFDLIFAMKPPKFLKNLKIYLKKKKNCETLDGFNEIHEMVSRVSKKRPFFKNTIVYREKIRPMWSNFTAIY